MKNFEIYNIAPQKRKLENDGVADVNSSSEDVLRYELKTFVCDGQYKDGMQRVLQTFLNNISKPEQPAVWVSGFYGSGKSHLVKMMSVLWENHKFSDGATARDVADLPQEINELFKELSLQGRRHGGLHSARGTLSSGASESVRLLIMGIIFKSAGLPENYAKSKLILWLRKEGIKQAVREKIAAAGGDWQEEIDNMYVAELLHQALVEVRPQTFPNTQSCANAISNMFPNKDDISNDEMIKTIRETLTQDGKMPLTLLVLDEMQQFIDNSTDRALRVQEAVKTCSNSMDGQVLIMATGQTAITGTACLAQIEGRFTVRVQLSEEDIDSVTRKVVLAKKPEAIASVEKVIKDNIGEISRHLFGSSISYRQEDQKVLAADYPILPTRRRFWECALRALDQTGTDSQLRNQLSMNLKMIQQSAESPLGNIAPGDFLFFDLAEKLMQSFVLPRQTYETIIPWYRTGTPDEKLTARACGLIFLINKLGNAKQELGLKANITTLADLMMDDLNAGSTALRQKLPELLDSCKQLMKIGDEYTIQTAEGLEWDTEFVSQKNVLKQNAFRTDSERDDRLKAAFAAEGNISNFLHGRSKIARQITVVFNQLTLPADAKNKITLWVRDGWHVDENTVKADARKAGLNSSVIFAYIPKRSVDEIRNQIVDFKAAYATLNQRGTPGTPEGKEARDAMLSRQTHADSKINELLHDVISGTVLYQGGGSEVVGGSLSEKIKEAAASAAVRLYPQFEVADNSDWSKVYDAARKGAPDALKHINYSGEAKDHPVCKQIMNYIGAGRTGMQIRETFDLPPYGWSKDAIDGALQALLVSGTVIATTATGKVENTKLERKNIGAVNFRLETVVISATQKIVIRKLFQRLGISTTGEDLQQKTYEFQANMEALAKAAGGEEPLPEYPDTSLLQSIKMATGNAQLQLIYENRKLFDKQITEWSHLKEQIALRFDHWITLVDLERHLSDSSEEAPLKAQIAAIRSQRQLLNDPDLVQPLVKTISDIYRTKLNRLNEEYLAQRKNWEAKLAADENWKKLTPEDRHSVRRQAHLLPYDLDVDVQVGSVQEILNTLTTISFAGFADKLAALQGRYTKAFQIAAKMLEPEVQYPSLPSFMLKTEADIDAWLAETKKYLTELLKNGPIQM